MASTTPHLNTTNDSRQPEIKFESNLTGKKVRKEWTAPLLVHAQASEKLRLDLEVFTERSLHSQTGLATDFLLGTRHHTVALLEPALVQIKEGLRGFHEVGASDQYLDKRLPSIGYLLDLAEKRLKALNDRWESVIKELGHQIGDYPVGTGRPVPTASPRHLLICLLANQSEILSKIRTDKGLSEIGSHLDLPSPSLKGEGLELKIDVADGSPKMFFVCRHDQSGVQKLFVGSSKADWEGLPAIGKIRKKDRDHRLRSYTPLAKEAFRALKKAEDMVMATSGLNPKTSLYEIRQRAIEKMRGTDSPTRSLLPRQDDRDWAGFR
ncbi:MAG: hypothetical protein M1839_006367 [Geoglossum umbratile]|nr:MAG: hypothetical protein M1839_006367 [Geoglossum umbratile]